MCYCAEVTAVASTHEPTSIYLYTIFKNQTNMYEPV